MLSFSLKNSNKNVSAVLKNFFSLKHLFYQVLLCSLASMQAIAAVSCLYFFISVFDYFKPEKKLYATDIPHQHIFHYSTFNLTNFDLK